MAAPASPVATADAYASLAHTGAQEEASAPPRLPTTHYRTDGGGMAGRVPACYSSCTRCDCAQYLFACFWMDVGMFVGTFMYVGACVSVSRENAVLAWVCVHARERDIETFLPREATRAARVWRHGMRTCCESVCL